MTWKAWRDSKIPPFCQQEAINSAGTDDEDPITWQCALRGSCKLQIWSSESKENNCTSSHHRPAWLHGRAHGRMDGSQKGAEIPRLSKSHPKKHFVQWSRINTSCRQRSEYLKTEADSLLLLSSSKWKPTQQLNVGSWKKPRDSEGQIKWVFKKKKCSDREITGRDYLYAQRTQTSTVPDVCQPWAVIGEGY